MRQKAFLAIAVAIAALCSCNKENNIIETPKGVQMTLNATIATPEVNTKAVVTETASGLKTAWSENDQISVITLDASGNLLTNDVFTSSNAAGATTAIFSGTFTGDPSNTIACYYPALTEGDGTVANEYYSVPPSLFDISLNNEYGFWSIEDKHMLQNGSLNLVESNTILSGEASISGENLTVALNHRLSSFKIVADISSTDFAKIREIEYKCGEEQLFRVNDWFYLKYFSGSLSGGNAVFSQSFFTSTPFSVDKNESLVLYLPACFVAWEIPSGTTIKFSISGLDASNNDIKYSATKTLGSDFTFEAGKCYNINISASELSKVED